MDTFELLKQLTESPGPSGAEGGAAATLQALWRPLVDDLAVDRVGSVVGVKRATTALAEGAARPSVLIATHLDELGLIVANVVEHDGYGFLRVGGLGGVDRRQLNGQLVVVHGRRDLTGVLGGLPDRMLPEKRRNQAYSYEDLVVDVGLPAEDVRQLVSIGDFVSFRQPLRKLLGGRVAGKALDNRSSVAALTLCLEGLQGRDHSWDVIAAGTSQEETVFLGAYTTAYARRPDLGIAVDVTHARGPNVSEHEAVELGSGPVLLVGANVHPAVANALRDAAKALEMSISTQPHAAGSGTDAYALQVTREGIPTGVLSIPLRYMHTMVETVDTADVERVGRLLVEFIIRLDDQFLPGLTAELMRPEGGAKA